MSGLLLWYFLDTLVTSVCLLPVSVVTIYWVSESVNPVNGGKLRRGDKTRYSSCLIPSSTVFTLWPVSHIFFLNGLFLVHYFLAYIPSSLSSLLSCLSPSLWYSFHINIYLILPCMEKRSNFRSLIHSYHAMDPLSLPLSMIFFNRFLWYVYRI